MRFFRFLSLLAIASVSVFASALMAQSSATPPRITSAVNESALIALKGNVPRMARTEFDKGQALASTQLTFMRLVLTRSADQQTALDKYDADLQDKSSTNYHKWLTPQQYGQLYGPADSDIAAIVAWLQSHGLKVESIPLGRTNIPFSGTVQQVEEALHTSIHSYEANGEQFYSNTTNPSIPSALSALVSGIAHLNTIKPRHNHVAGKVGMFDPGTGRLTPVLSARITGPTADLTVGSGTTSDPYFLYIVPGDAATTYDTPTTFNANYAGSANYNGLGVTIGIGGDAPILPTTVANFRSTFLGDSIQPIITNVDGVTDTSDTDEAYIDTELSGGMAPGATIHFYTANDLGTAINQMLNDNFVDIFSLSFGYCEELTPAADNAWLNSAWQQAETQGIAVTISTGDSGSAGCDNQNKVTAASRGLQVSGWSSTPHNIAVGGTDTAGLLSTFTTYVGLPSTGTSSTYYRTAKSYIPESTWNDSTSVNTTISADKAFTGSSANIWGGAGGASSCSSQSASGACTGGYAKPWWQRGTGVPADGVRDVPDVSLMAGLGSDNAAWLVCTDGTFTQSGTTYTEDCSTTSNGFAFSGWGGTSTAAPSFAGILALVQQKTGGRLGQAAKELYDLYNGSHASAIFHDITVGNNSVPCVSATLNCSKNAAGNYFLTGYNTTAGYDLATGIGSVDATQLVTYWGSAIGTQSSTVTAVATPSIIAYTQGTAVGVTVAGSQGTPTGSVVLSSGSYTSGAQALSAGVANISIPVGNLNVGTDTLTATYTGDATYSNTSGTTTVTVTGLTPALTVNASPTSINSSATVTVSGTVSGSGATPTGTVTVSGGGYTSAATALSATGKYTVAIPANSLAASTDTLIITYSGDVVYSALSGSTSVTVTASVYTLAATPPAAVTAGGSATSTITVSTTTAYLGAVTLTCALTTSPSGATKLPTCTAASTGSTVTLNSTASATGTVSIATTAATTSRLERRGFGGWAGAGGGAILAFLVFVGVPRRNRLTMLSVFLALVALGSMAACGGSSGSGGGGTTTPGTSTGTYTFTVTGSGNPAVTPAPTTTFTLTVN